MDSSSPQDAVQQDVIHIEGAQEHNLKNISLSIPRNQWISFTGPSGSGKSSLAFDTLFREGQRRYLETLSTHARRYVEKMDRPHVEHVQGLSPAAAVGQRGVTASSRSTVGTLSETYDYLRLLYGRLGSASCIRCQEPLTTRDPLQIAETLFSRFQGQHLTLAAPLVEDHRGSREQLFKSILREGFQKVRVDGIWLPLDPMPQIEESQRHTIEVWIGDVLLNSGSQNHLENLVEKALLTGSGVLRAITENQEERHDASNSCGHCGEPFPAIGPRLFSFNSSFGACKTCNGLGLQEQVSEDALIADANKTLREGALVPTTPNGYIVYSQVTVDVMNDICQAHGFSVDIPFKDLTHEQTRVIFYGSNRLKVPFGKHSLESRMKWSGIKAKPREEGYYKGLIPVIEETLKRNRNKNILRFVASVPCSDCGGARLSEQARAVKIGEYGILDLAQQSFSQLTSSLDELPFNQAQQVLAEPIIAGLKKRLAMLENLGLGYLTMDRGSESLSGGEGRRIRLASEIQTSLRGMLYVLDEPGMGLHYRDRSKLLEVLHNLRDVGNTVISVEHDMATLRSCDHVVDLGPGSGKSGGELLFNGTPEALIAEASGLTASYLRGDTTIEIPTTRRAGSGQKLSIFGASHFNLKQIDVHFVLGAFNVVSGVSGSGKSNLVDGLLAAALKKHFHQSRIEVGAHRSIEGLEHIDKVIHINQAPIGRTPRSNPATYTGVFDAIRLLFANQPLAQERGYPKGWFSTNTQGGRCETCQGAGVVVLGMHGLPDVSLLCDGCGGKRFHEEILEVLYRDKNIRDVLEMTVAEALEFFCEETAIHRYLTAMDHVGLGYLALGQSSLTLSGGEAQRVKLASELARPDTGKTLYILDEPTTGLHPSDVKVLLEALFRLVDKGNTVIAVEHHLDVVKCADHVIDLGPESGEEGGYVVACGTPETVASQASSYTGMALRQVFEKGMVSLPKRATTPYQASPIRLRGVRTHNLKGVDVDIPVGCLTVITGVSGSGKSSLAFDTLYGECRRRFSESLSTHARRMIGGKNVGNAEHMEGLFPAVAVGRSSGAVGARSTVGTATHIYDHLRLLFSRIGVEPHPQGDRLSARHFSFNHHQGACDGCGGLGSQLVGDPHKMVSHPERSLLAGALDGHKCTAFYGDPHGQYTATLKVVADHLKLDFSKPWNDLDENHRRIAMFGTGETLYDVTWRYKRGQREGEHQFQSPWAGFTHLVEEEYVRKSGDKRGDEIRVLLKDVPCEVCGGERISRRARKVEINGLTLPQLTGFSMDRLDGFLAALEHPVAIEIYQALKTTLNALSDVGVAYLTCARSMSSLSGGELQRVRLAGQLGGGLVGVTYVLDEPTVGLHSRDTHRLLKVLRQLVKTGNTVVVVEHDETIIRAADHIIEMGPGAGEQGGRVVFQGNIQEMLKSNTATGRHLADPREHTRKMPREGSAADLCIRGANAHNLKNLDVSFPKGALTVVAGVSGSGKSSLVFDVLAASATRGAPVNCSEIVGLDDFEVVIGLNQIPLSGGSNPVARLNLFDKIRGLFANTDKAGELGLKKTAFSPQNKLGRCDECHGSGMLKTAMDFLEDVVIPCQTCGGKRFNSKVLQVNYKGRNMAEVLDMPVTEACVFFGDVPSLKEGLEILEEVGLGYLRLGRDTRSLSGGEAQRLKLATRLQLGKKQKGKSLYLLDEPTTGLHFQDVEALLVVMRKLVDAGHTLIVVEHHERLIAAADHVVGLGPEGGEKGGYLFP